MKTKTITSINHRNEIVSQSNDFAVYLKTKPEIRNKNGGIAATYCTYLSYF